jgi:cell division protein FtsW
MRVSRADRSRLVEWWFTVDHTLLFAVLTLMTFGLILSLAASPAVALNKGLPPYYFVQRHFVFATLGGLFMLAVSLCDPATLRRIAMFLFVASLAALVVVYFNGKEINGAKRWLSVFGVSFQPSEIAKPAFVVVSAWFFAESRHSKDMPALTFAFLTAAIVLALLIVQPDVGQTVLVSLVWGTLYFVSGQPLIGGIVLAVLGLAGLVGAYLVFPHVEARIDRFLWPSAGDNSQIDRAMRSFTEGGFFGRGPGEGTIKTVLPDAHTDFIFAVVAEEYGIIACLILLALFTFVVVRALHRVRYEQILFVRLSVIGLAMLFGLQAAINMGVNIGLLPAKGMTLPFISAGGSSIIGVSLTVGMMLALTRRRADYVRQRRPAAVATVGGERARRPVRPQ